MFVLPCSGPPGFATDAWHKGTPYTTATRKQSLLWQETKTPLRVRIGLLRHGTMCTEDGMKRDGMCPVVAPRSQGRQCLQSQPAHSVSPKPASLKWTIACLCAFAQRPGPAMPDWNPVPLGKELNAVLPCYPVPRGSVQLNPGPQRLWCWQRGSRGGGGGGSKLFRGLGPFPFHSEHFEYAQAGETSFSHSPQMKNSRAFWQTPH